MKTNMSFVARWRRPGCAERRPAQRRRDTSRNAHIGTGPAFSVPAGGQSEMGRGWPVHSRTGRIAGVKRWGEQRRQYEIQCLRRHHRGCDGGRKGGFQNAGKPRSGGLRFRRGRRVRNGSHADQDGRAGAVAAAMKAEALDDKKGWGRRVKRLTRSKRGRRGAVVGWQRRGCRCSWMVERLGSRGVDEQGPCELQHSRKPRCDGMRCRGVAGRRIGPARACKPAQVQGWRR